MATPLSTPPLAPNGNYSRSMFVWVGPPGNTTLDPIANTTNQQTLLNFCGTNKVTRIFFDIYSYLGGSTYPPTTQETRLHTFLDVAHRSGIQVHALAGNVDWAINQSWVNTNIFRNLTAFQCKGTSAQHLPSFDGFCLDVEYWTDPNQTANISAPALCDMMRAMQRTLQTAVGCFAAFYLKDNTGSRPSFTYQGKTAQDGEFITDNADYVVVGAYRDDAASQNALFEPWYDYASQVGVDRQLYCGSETGQDIENPQITYYGATKTFMESQHTIISTTFTNTMNTVFLGQAIDDYAAYKVMATFEEFQLAKKEAENSLLPSYLWSSTRVNRAAAELKEAEAMMNGRQFTQKLKIHELEQRVVKVIVGKENKEDSVVALKKENIGQEEAILVVGSEKEKVETTTVATLEKTEEKKKT